MRAESELILYLVCDGDPIKSANARASVRRKMILNYYYKKRVAGLNEMLSTNEQLRRIKKD